MTTSPRTLEVINIPGNTILVDRSKEIKEGDWYYYKDEEDYDQIFNWAVGCVDNTAKKGKKIVAQQGKEYLSMLPDIPLFNPEDLIVKERYTIVQYRITTPYNSIIGDLEFKLFDNIKKEYLTSLFYNKEQAQDYCDYLNRKETNVDVEKMFKDIDSEVEQRIIAPNKEHSFGDSFISGIYACKNLIKHLVTERLNTAPKGGYSRGDMKRIIINVFKSIKSVWYNCDPIIAEEEDVEDWIQESIDKLKHPLTVTAFFNTEKGEWEMNNGFLKIGK